MSYTKLFSSIVHSTIWRESNEVRLVWITMLALADRDGVVEASIPGLADAARVSLPECERALAILSAPDPYSRSKLKDGRRIEACKGGWSLVNYDEYRHRASKEDSLEKAAERQRRWRARNARETPVTLVTRNNDIAEAEEEASQKEDLTCKGGSKDLTGQSDQSRPEDTPAHVQRHERSFWPTVHLWEGPTVAHRDFARQNGLDVELEAKQYRANRRKCDFRCADFNADFEEWLAKSLKFARRTPAGATSAEDTRELNDADRAAIAKARRAAKRAMEA